MKYKITSYACSNIGLVRTTNEDFFAQLEKENFFILADGMGGHNAGEVASKETVEFLCSEMENLHQALESIHNHDSLADLMHLLLEKVNKRICNLSMHDFTLNGMGTTVCSSFFHNNRMIYSHVGDSRLYRYRNNTLTQLTTDHSLLEKSKGKLTQAIGTQKKIEPEIGIEEVFPNDIYFLCSDGLTDCVSDMHISKILDESTNIGDTTETLIEEAMHRGGRDNITIIMMKVDEHLSRQQCNNASGP